MSWRLTSLLVFLIVIAFADGVPAAADADGIPFTIIRASLDEDGRWEVHQFTLLCEESLPVYIEPAFGAVGLEISVLDYALFRARHTLDFEGGLREGLTGEFKRRDRIKKASYWGAYLYCAPVWPVHLVWELAVAGVEKGRMLNLEGYTIHLPIVKGGAVGEMPLKITQSGSPNSYIIEPPDVGPGEICDWRGAGLHLSYFLENDKADLEVITELFPGWQEETQGTLIIFLEFPFKYSCRLQVGEGEPVQIFSSWPGRFEWPLGNAVYVSSGDKAYLGLREVKVRRNEQVRFGTSPKFESPEKKVNSEVKLRTIWPPIGALVSEHPFLAMLISGALISLILFHIVNLFGLHINYRGNAIAAFYEPLISHIILLALATIFAPFFGLGWILGAYVSGRFLKGRHPEIRNPWFVMMAYALLVAVVYEAIFVRSLWV